MLPSIYLETNVQVVVIFVAAVVGLLGVADFCMAVAWPAWRRFRERRAEVRRRTAAEVVDMDDWLGEGNTRPSAWR